MNAWQKIALALSLAAFGAIVGAPETANGRTAQAIASQGASVGVGQIASINGKPANVSSRRRRKAEKVFLAGATAIEKGDPRAAERDFERAHELDPDNRRYPLSAEITRQSVIKQLVLRALNESSLGNKDNAFAIVEEALRFDPASPMIAECIAKLAGSLPAQPTAHTELVELSEPLAPAPQDGLRSFHLRTDKRSLILQVLNAFGIRATVDTSVNGGNLHFDADNVEFAQAADLLKLATDTFFVTFDSKDVMAVADNPENRNRFERLVTKIFYFPGLNSKELTDMESIALDVFGVERSTIEPGKSTLTVRAPERELEALDQTYSELLGGRSELQLEMGVYEIDKTKATNIGVILPTSTTIFNVPSEINSILTNNASLVDQLLKQFPSLAGNYEAILAALIASGALTGTVFNSPFTVFGGGLTQIGLDLSGVGVNLLLNSSDARSFHQQELRVLDQEQATFRSGERYPIMTSSYSSLASSSSSNNTIPQIQYEDLGLTLKVTPHVELGHEVSLNLDLQISSLAGSSLNNIPILTNRQYSGVVSLRLEDSAILVTDLSKQESLDITGLPGLGDIPRFSGTTNRQDSKNLMELAVVITPHLIRLAHSDTVGPMLLLPSH